MAQKRTEHDYELNRQRAKAYYQTEAGKQSKARYEAKITRVLINLNPERDADIFAALDMEQNLAPQLKQLIKEAVAIRNALGK